MDITQPVIGDAIKADGWPAYGAELLTEDDGFKDNSFPGCQFRVGLKHTQMAVNVTATGKPHLTGCGGGVWTSRCKIEFVGDGAPSQFSGGVIYHHRSIG
jgi:hypothetical protein